MDSTKPATGAEEAKPVDQEADTEGHFLPNPALARELASQREREIQRKLQHREHELEAKRPHRK
jgi:hypothetical protein